MNTPQLPLGLRFPRDQRLDSYRDPPPGLLAMLSAFASGAEGSAFLCGPSGSGRRHLLLATCAQASVAGHAVAYLPLRAFGARAADALAQQGMVRPACVDDVQAIAGDREAEVALFDLHTAPMPARRRTRPMRHRRNSTIAVPDLLPRPCPVHPVRAFASGRSDAPGHPPRTRAGARTGTRRRGDGLAAPSRSRSQLKHTDCPAGPAGSRIARGAAENHGAVPAADADYRIP